MPKYYRSFKRRGISRSTYRPRRFARVRRGRGIFRRRGSYRRSTFTRKPLVTPLAIKRRLRYVEFDGAISTGITTPSAAFLSYKINSAYDISNKGGSHSVPGFNELAALYGRYMVIGAKVNVSFVNGGPYNLICFLIMNQNSPSSPPWSTSWSALNAFQGNALSRFKTIHGNIGATPTGASGKCSLSMYQPMARIWGNKTEYYGSGNFSAPTNTNPNRVMGCWVGFMTNGGSTMPAGYFMDIKLTIDIWVRFYDRKTWSTTTFPGMGEEEAQDNIEDTVVPQSGDVQYTT